MNAIIMTTGFCKSMSEVGNFDCVLLFSVHVVFYVN